MLTSGKRWLKLAVMKNQERSEISFHEIQVFRLLKSAPEKWFTHKQISETSKMNERTVRSHTLRFVRLGLVDQAEVFPAHRYRWSEKAQRRNGSYLLRLNQADSIFGQQ